jgi:hypothetical protein
MRAKCKNTSTLPATSYCRGRRHIGILVKLTALSKPRKVKEIVAIQAAAAVVVRMVWTRVQIVTLLLKTPHHHHQGLQHESQQVSMAQWP